MSVASRVDRKVSGEESISPDWTAPQPRRAIARRLLSSLRLALTGAACLACGAPASPCLAQDAPPDPAFIDGEPRVWCWNDPLGDAATDPRFVRMVQYNISYGFATQYSPEGAANAIATEVKNRALTEGRVAVMLLNVGLGNLRAGQPANGRIPALYAHEEDLIKYDYPSGEKRLARGAWMDAGIGETRAWTERFLAQYAVRQQQDPALAAPTRFVFDQEPSGICSGPLCLPVDVNPGGIEGTIAWWTALINDPRARTEQLVGFPQGTTLHSYWVDSGRPKPGVVRVGYNYSYMGGSLANQNWYTWVLGLFTQLEAGALEESMIVPIHATFPDAKCSDYSGSLRMDGKGRNRHLTPNYVGSRGASFAWNDRSADLQAVELYPTTSGYTIDQENLGGPISWQSPITGDACATGQGWFAQSFLHPRGLGIEPPGESALRFRRYNIDACVRSFGGAHRDTLAPWVTVPDERFNLSVLRVQANQYIKVAHRAAPDDCARMLGLARSRGAKELMVWNNWALAYGSCQNTPAIRNSTVHTQQAGKWNMLRDALDFHWSTSLEDASPTPGAQAPGTPDLVSLLAQSEGDSAQVSGTTGTPGLLLWFRADAATKKGLRLDVECVSSQQSQLRAWLYSTRESRWDVVDMDPSSPSDARVLCAGATVRASGVLEFGAQREFKSYLDDNGRVHAWVGFDGPVGTTVAADLVQLQSWTPARMLADFSGDGVVTPSDKVEFETFHAMVLADPAGGCTKGIEMDLLVDFDRSGTVNTDDLAAFRAEYDRCVLGNCARVSW
jgi:hypothetical protein